MSRSYRKHDYIGICGGHHISEKYDKQIAILTSLQEVSDIWSFNKDGKRYFGYYKSMNSSKYNSEYWLDLYKKMKRK